MDAFGHRPVLVREATALLAPRPGGTYVDGTLGLGGHAEAILEAAGGPCRLIGFEWDDDAAERAERRLARFGAAVTVARASYAELGRVLDNLGVRAVDGLLLDLGVSSLQLDDASRGFSFTKEGPLDLRMSRRIATTAADLLADLDEGELERLFRELGEEPRARAVARALGRLPRAERRAMTTTRLAQIVSRVAFRGRIHPATRVFQALRIAVNRELDNLQTVLRVADDYLAAPGGRIAVISFHSLEDRIVKHALREKAREGRLTVLTRKPVRPDADEVRENPRSRSAKLRAAERTEAV